MEEPRLGQFCAEYQGLRVPIRWHEWGPPSGRPVVCVHGLTRTGRDFDALARALAAAGRRVLCPDVPGRGLSGWLPDPALYAVPTYLALLQPLLAAVGPHDFVGTSMGGLIGMAAAAQPELRTGRLVLNDVGPFLPAAALARIRAYLAAAPQEFPDLAALEGHLRRVHAPFGPLSDAEWAHLARHSARITPAGRIALHYDPRILEPMPEQPTDLDLWALWPQVATGRPVLVLRGEHSDLLDAATAARMAESPGVQLATIRGVGHAPALMEPGQITLIRDFLG
ncbi:MAG: alpha/beta hydrolase [Rhodovarius sp.]|nr:alpha/beta hydrolase [Rhodovarius sp.]MDW8313680.1 alpha/beta hydrolase [Rhodovarius sp.]